MKLSEDRISHLSHLICDGIWKDDLVDYTNEHEALKEIKRTITEYLHLGDEADEAARAKIRSLSKDVPEGSPEWDILYRKYLAEETAKKTF
ncbi:hypothetical protein MNBD_DELTA01-576 [hydrothermal vent metagenome]|uniref:DUF507 domain-containing protein n=1 Tax=hydrothermal vent metagenome TaxID=652676 RepID=A0A3B0R709_9ZZZZ